MAKADGTPIPLTATGGKQMAHPPPKKLLFLHGFGENHELLDAFALDGLRACFGKGCKVDVIAGDHTFSAEEVREHMLPGELREMAMAGDVSLTCWGAADRSAYKATVLEQRTALMKPSLEHVLRHFEAQRGYDVIVGFSDGGTIAYELLAHAERLTSARLQTPLRMLAVLGAAEDAFVCSDARSWAPMAPEAALRGLKLFQAKGSTDSGFCSNVHSHIPGCKGELSGSFWMCEASNPYEFALCASCAAKARPGGPDADRMFANCPAKCRERPLVQCEAGHAADPALFVRLASQGLEVVGNATWAGGHRLPGAGERMWHHLAQFYAGRLGR